MKLTELIESDIRSLAGGAIFNRGYDYFEQESVCEFDYDADADRIVAEVYGNYGDAEVEITSEDEGIDPNCSCPYDGYPCKHVVAVLLTFVHDQEKHMQQAAQHQGEISSLKDKIRTLAQAELAEIEISCLDKYADVRRDMAVCLAPAKKLTLNTILKQVEKAYADVQAHHHPETTLAEQLRTILKSVEGTSVDMRVKVYWAIVDRTLAELNEYGMSDQSLETLAAESILNPTDFPKFQKLIIQRLKKTIEESQSKDLWLAPIQDRKSRCSPRFTLMRTISII